MLSFLRKTLDLRLCTAVAGLLLATVFCFWWYGSPKRVNEAMREITEIVDDIHKNYVRKNSYWGVNSSTLESNKRLRRRGNQTVNAFGKPILVGQGENGDTVMPGDRTFDVVFTELSFGECVRSATSNFASPETLGLMQVKIIGKSEQVFIWGNKQYNLPLPEFQAKEFCDKDSKVIWTFE